MKKYLYLSLFVTFIVLLGCSDMNSPSVSPQKESGYRLDSAVYYRDDTVSQKTIYYCSEGSEHPDSSYQYIRNNNQWILKDKNTYKYDSRWNTVEQFYSVWNDSRWGLNTKYDYSYDNKGYLVKQTVVSYDNQGAENYRTENQYEYDSSGNEVLSVTESYLKGRYLGYNAYKTDWYFTGNRLDSIYHFRKQDKDAQFECSDKQINLKFDEYNNCTEYTIYTYKDNQFVINSKTVTEYDSHRHSVLWIYYEWKNDDWLMRYHTESTYQYLPDTDLIREHTLAGTDYYDSGEVAYQNVKEKYYYTKL